MKNTQKGFSSLSIILLVLVLAVGAYIKLNPKILTPEPIFTPEGVFCTMDAKLCPDGSYVGRTGPKCEFSECPTTTSGSKEETTASLNQKIFLGGGIYITPLEVLSDSRCPIDVTCIWAGEITLKVKVEKDGSSKDVEIKEGETIDAGPGIVSLVDVVPENNTKKPLRDVDYRFTFKVDWKLD